MQGCVVLVVPVLESGSFDVENLCLTAGRVWLLFLAEFIVFEQLWCSDGVCLRWCVGRKH